MKFTDIFVRRPVLASAISVFILIIGVFALFKLPLRMFPEVQIPTISIQTNYSGASAQTMQDTVTSVIQKAIVGIEGINYITSTSSTGSSEVDVHLNPGINPDLALTDIMSKVSSVTNNLPQAADKPTIAQQQDDTPVMVLAVDDPQMTSNQIGDYLSRVVEPKLEAISGVSQAQVGMNDLAMHISLDPQKMAALGITPQDIDTALQQQNVQAAPGATKGENVLFNITTDTDLKTADGFNDLVIKNDDGKLIRLKDVGFAELASKNGVVSVYYEGKQANVMIVYGLPSANPLDIGAQINQELPNIKQQLPPGMQINPVMSAATYIKASIGEVMKSIIEGIIIVVLVIFLCIGSLRSVIVPVVTIPLSLIGVCFFMMILGYSINLLTLLAMVLAIGLVVDDAIVVVENIFRHIEEGIEPLKAALGGARELATPIIAMTITLAAVFFPIGFMGGVTGQLFSEFALTLAGAVIISGVVALTLSPMMCGRLLNKDIAEARMVKIADNSFNFLRDIYHKSLEFLLSYKKFILAFWIIILLAVAYLYSATPKEMAPKEDYGTLLVFGNAPSNVTPAYIDRYSQRLNDIYKKVPFLKTYAYVNGIPASNQVLSFLKFEDWKDRNMSVMQISPILQKALNQIPGLQFQVSQPSGLPGSRNTPVEFVLTSVGDYQGLYAVSQKLLAQAQESGMFAFIDTDLKYDQPQLQINIDRNAAATLGISMQDIAKTLSILMGGNKLQQISIEGHTYDVVPEVYQKYRLNPQVLGEANVKTANGKLVPLSSVISMKTVIAPATLSQFQKLNAVTFSGVMAPGHTLSQGLDFLKAHVQGQLPAGMSYNFAGESRRFLEEGNRMLLTFLLAVIVIYLVLAIQFESYRDPFIILLGSVPMSLFGALIFLKAGATTINIYSELGLLTLVGLVSKHGILMTKFANEWQLEQGAAKAAAIIEAAKVRFRPIIMTTAAMVCGAIPLLTVTGPGSESRFAIGVVISTGMLIGTIFTLFVVPTLYILMARDRSQKKA